jgi:hypothetical protein
MSGGIGCDLVFMEARMGCRWEELQTMMPLAKVGSPDDRSMKQRVEHFRRAELAEAFGVQSEVDQQLLQQEPARKRTHWQWGILFLRPQKVLKSPAHRVVHA